jgi:hypothetical protein
MHEGRCAVAAKGLVMDRDNLRMRTVQGLSWLEAEVNELAAMAGYRSEADGKLFKIQLKRIRHRISEFEKDLIDLLIAYPEPRDTDPLSRLLERRALRRLDPTLKARTPQQGS